MAIKLRLSRGGRKAIPFYRIVVADSRAARDGAYIERVGTYNPLLAQDNAERVVLNVDRVKHWLAQGAQPTERVAMMLGKAGLLAMPKQTSRPNQAKPKAKAQERIKEQAALAEAKIAAEQQAKADAEAAAAQPAAEASAPAADEAAA